MPWLQLRIDTDRQHTEAIEDALLFAGAASVTLQDNADQPILEPALGETPLWDNVRLTALFEADINIEDTIAATESLYGQTLQNYQWEQLEDKAWEREWMKNYHPIYCGGRLWICPSWLEPPDPEAVNLLLDPGLAFGTGTHPTTFMCLQWLAEQDPLRETTLIDYGCGSGILGMAALLLGAKQVTGTDIDPQALIATHDNCDRNSIPKALFPVFLPQNCSGEPVDIVVANILAGPLAELAPTLTDLTRAGGKLCLSGVLATQAQVVMDAYAQWFAFEPPREQEEWVCLTATKIA